MMGIKVGAFDPGIIIYLLHIATPTAASAITEVSLLFYQTHTYNILLLQR